MSSILTDFSLYKTREQIVGEMLADLLSAIPDAYTDFDGTLRIVFEIEGGQLENVYLANQLLLDDQFVQTASLQALRRHGQQYGLELKDGTLATGQVTFEGDGGTYVPVNAEVAYAPGNGLPAVYFNTTEDGTIPNPGIPSAPLVAVNATAGNLNGVYEYAVTFLTDSGETLMSEISDTVSPANEEVDLTDIPLGGPGTIGRRIYRDKDISGTFRLVAEIDDNVTVVYTDNATDATMNAGALAPTVDTAHRITLATEAQAPGVSGNVAIGTVTEGTQVPSGIRSIWNDAIFAGGQDQEDTETFRGRVLAALRNPQTGSADDLKAWAENISGVEQATVSPNTPGPGEVTVTISGPGGSIPTDDVVQAVSDDLYSRDLANVTIHVGPFVADPISVTVDVTTSGTYALGDVTPSVENAIATYINGLDVGEELKISGIIGAVFGLPGVDDVAMVDPLANVPTAAGSKKTPDVITVT